MVEVLRHEDFAPHVDKLFRFDGWHGALRLTSISSVEPSRPFSLLFQGPLGVVLPEGLYTAIVDETLRLEFYIMPIHTPAGDRQDYQAVFN